MSQARERPGGVRARGERGAGQARKGPETVRTREGHGTILVAVAVGSALGAVLRYGIGVGALHLAAAGFPWGTLAANVLGSFIIGAVATLTLPDGRMPAGPAIRHFVVVGVCGGLTTFSIFSVETLALLQAGLAGMVGANLLASLLLWVPAAWVGSGIGRSLWPARTG